MLKPIAVHISVLSLKSAGSILILLASGGMAYSCVMGLHRQLRSCEQLMDLLTALEGEITYSRCPLPHLLPHLAQQLPGAYQDILLQGSRCMQDNNEADICSLWKNVCEQFRSGLSLPEDAYQILLRTGEVFAFSSLESSVQLLRLGRNKLAALIESRQAEFAGRRKVYCCLCCMAGLASIIFLL